MSIEKRNFDALSEGDLREIVEGAVPEGLRIEYKAETYETNDRQKREFLKDISAFANAQGGHLLLGLEERGGAASALTGLALEDTDAEILRLLQLARSGLEPRISDLRIKSVPLESGRHVLVIRVPKSWNPPHRVIAQGANRFYVRHSAGVHEPDVQELRVLFVQSTSALDQARSFRRERLAAIKGGEGNRPLINQGRLLLHVVPVAAFSGGVSLSVEAIHEKHMLFRPIGAIEGFSPCFNYRGFINERRETDLNHGYTQVYRNGIIEAVKANVRHMRGNLPYVNAEITEKELFTVFPDYLTALRDLEVPPPLILMLTLEGLEGARIGFGGNVLCDENRPLPEEDLLLPESVLEDYGDREDYHRVIRPAFDALWNAIGHSKSPYFNENGVWVGRH